MVQLKFWPVAPCTLPCVPSANTLLYKVVTSREITLPLCILRATTTTNDAYLGDFLGLVRFFEKRIRPDLSGEFWTVDRPDTILGDTEIKFGGDGTVMPNAESRLH